ncbi:MAG: PadR family transcriptional regulator [Chloroflexota bacterium]|nr:PadR family transcriptional regulator [Chloroflexota bacterium]
MQISEPAEYALLGLLESQSMHGYEMFHQFESGILGQIVHLEMSQMYAFLKKMERLNYIEAQLELQGTRPPRKVFHLTKLGRTVFREWLTEPVERPRDIRLLFLIKLYFVQRIMPDTLPHIIEAQIDQCHRFLKHLEAQQQQIVHTPLLMRQEHVSADNGKTSDDIFFEQVVLRSRIFQLQALIKWLQEIQPVWAMRRT